MRRRHGLTLVPPFAFMRPMNIMKTFQWLGEDCNLGRFGAVRKGDILNLTEQEAAMVKNDRDKRYVQVGEGKQPKPISHLITIDPAKMTPLQMEQAHIENMEEERRLERLKSETDPERVLALAMQAKTTHDLLVQANEINLKAGRQVIPVTQGTQRGQIIAALCRELSREAGKAAKDLQEQAPAA